MRGVIRHLWRAAIYLAFGALFVSLFMGGHFDWQAPMTYVWLLLWPLMLIAYASMTFLLILALVLAVIGLYTVVWG